MLDYYKPKGKNSYIEQVANAKASGKLTECEAKQAVSALMSEKKSRRTIAGIHTIRPYKSR